MKKELFISDKCIHSVNLLEEEEKNPNYTKDEDVEIINITENMANLKRFLSYRDKLEAFDKAKEDGKVGIPSLVIEGEKVEFPGQY